MNPLDTMIQGVAPTVMVPKHEPFTPLSKPGHRFLMASDGMWLEVKRAWMYARIRLARQHRVFMPYGALTEEVMLPRRVPRALLERFAELAEAQCPVEAAGAIGLDLTTKQFVWLSMTVLEASRGHVRYAPSGLKANEQIVIDLHSHGTGAAFFSSVDDNDDKSEVKISAVLGRCDGQPEIIARLCLMGVFIPLQLVAEENAFSFSLGQKETGVANGTPYQFAAAC